MRISSTVTDKAGWGAKIIAGELRKMEPELARLLK